MKYSCFFFMLTVPLSNLFAAPVITLDPDKWSGLEKRTAVFVTDLSKKDYRHAAGFFDNRMTNALPREKLGMVWDSVQKKLGPFRKLLSFQRKSFRGYYVILARCSFEKGLIDIKTVFNDEQQISGLFFLPVRGAGNALTGKPPSYVDRSKFTETDITVGATGWPLPGLICRPRGAGPFPALVLVHGSGPNDRDETIGPNKPFRDLAWGLASKGIVVIRYDKRTLVHKKRVVDSAENFTVRQETVDDAVACAGILRKLKYVDNDRIFVLGHSLGGYLIPRIGHLAGNSLAGLIVMAGSSRPLEDLIVEQTTYISGLDGNISVHEKAAIESIRKDVSAIKALSEKDARDTGKILFCAWPPYWLDLKHYDPIEAAMAIKTPMLFLQGERDYQVTMKDFNLWKTGLLKRKNTCFKTYPKLNHLFMEGEGPSSPNEYSAPSHVAAYVINDISEWISRY